MGLYQEMFGLKKVINASGTMSFLGGSLMPLEVIEAMDEAAKDWVVLSDLLDVAGARIAEIAGVESCLISSGCSACMTLAAAACITGMDREKMDRLPNTEGLKNEIVWQRGHYPAYASQFAAAGARIVVVEGERVVLDTPNVIDNRQIPALRTLGVSPEAIEKAITDKTFALAFSIGWFLPQRGLVSLEQICKIAHNHDLPVIVDAASELPYFENGKFDLGRFNRIGADIVCFSGGKAMYGPNDTGIAIGRKDIVEAARMQANPNRGIGRSFKVSKEQVVGLLVAIERCARLDWNKVLEEEHHRAKYIVKELTDIPHISTDIVFPDETGLPVARIWIRLDEKSLGISAKEVMEEMKNGDPSIYLRHGYSDLSILVVDVQVMKPGEESIVAKKLKKILTTYI